MHTSIWKTGETTGSALAILLGMLFLGGCGSSRDAAQDNLVRGTVRFSDGAPLPGGELHLTYDNKRDEIIGIDHNGSFARKGLPLGKVKVWIRSASSFTPLPPNMPAKEFRQDVKKVSIPVIYTNPNSTPWTWEIAPGTNEKEFIIERK
jgi:hypothetical protein